jgi:hypothetical protein
VLVEATRPNTTEPTHDRWEHCIVEHGYRFAVFDGLNRFYVRHEDEELISAVALAPNIFDDFIPNIYKRQIDSLNARLTPYRAADTVVRSIARFGRAIVRRVAPHI